MPVLCDFTVIQGDINKVIGDDGVAQWEETFNTGGRCGQAVLMFMVKGLTSTTNNVDVKINGKVIGKIYHYNGANASHWFTQIINVGKGYLNDGDNLLQIHAVSFPDAESGNIYDDFSIRDVIIFFQQRS